MTMKGMAIMMTINMITNMTAIMPMMMMMEVQRTSTVVRRRPETLPKAEKTAFDHSLECRHIAGDMDDNYGRTCFRP